MIFGTGGIFSQCEAGSRLKHDKHRKDVRYDFFQFCYLRVSMKKGSIL